ncbi:chorismate synthase [Ruminiclostridium papyrosolvens]|uniref:Chorismate synthase n=1 Tax=Ruminiclostridium papyrosolvens C7 TaxID=1330534 RepID=U4QZ28_9FIRM|nr:chorismate synthase [Ruminiclostridium papyrosolvens]EPR10206.1 hypothetical protein L323_14340 [Ruminiclostridium papyrosolvens C7]
MNTLGEIFRCTTWGESHGEAIGCVIDGCPAGLEITAKDFTCELDRDITDAELGTPRKESNNVKLLSGVFEGKTLGTPICIVIYNDGQKSGDYYEFKDYYRPGHAEFSYHNRYGFYDYRGGGRSSGRVFISLLAAAAISKKLLKKHNIAFESKVVELAGICCENEEAEKKAKEKCLKIASYGDSSGGIISLRIKGVPSGVGSPVFGKLNSMIMYALSSIGGVKGIECGLGIESAQMCGSRFNDSFIKTSHGASLASNNSGGFLGGISTGMDLLFRIAVKPTPSILCDQNTVNNKTMNEEVIKLKGRFDKNFTPRVGPLAEALASIVLVDQMILSGHINPVRIV